MGAYKLEFIFFFLDNGVKATKYLVINYEKENLIKN